MIPGDMLKKKAEKKPEKSPGCPWCSRGHRLPADPRAGSGDVGAPHVRGFPDRRQRRPGREPVPALRDGAGGSPGGPRPILSPRRGGSRPRRRRPERGALHPAGRQRGGRGHAQEGGSDVQPPEYRKSPLRRGEGRDHPVRVLRPGGFRRPRVVPLARGDGPRPGDAVRVGNVVRRGKGVGVAWRFLLAVLLGGVCYLDRTAACQLMLHRPLVVATLMGAIFGNMAAGAQIGVVLELDLPGPTPRGGVDPSRRHGCGRVEKVIRGARRDELNQVDAPPAFIVVGCWLRTGRIVHVPGGVDQGGLHHGGRRRLAVEELPVILNKHRRGTGDVGPRLAGASLVHVVRRNLAPRVVVVGEDRPQRGNPGSRRHHIRLDPAVFARTATREIGHAFLALGVDVEIEAVVLGGAGGDDVLGHRRAVDGLWTRAGVAGGKLDDVRLVTGHPVVRHRVAHQRVELGGADVVATLGVVTPTVRADHRPRRHRVAAKALAQRSEVDPRAARSLSIEARRDRGGVDLQLVLAGGRSDGAGLSSCTWPTRRRSNSTRAEVHRR